MTGIGAPQAQRSYAEKFVSFAANRSPNSQDTCIVDQLTPAWPRRPTRSRP
jgi:hypothetical protein